jgi:hypothetical protein
MKIIDIGNTRRCRNNDRWAMQMIRLPSDTISHKNKEVMFNLPLVVGWWMEWKWGWWLLVIRYGLIGRAMVTLIMTMIMKMAEMIMNRIGWREWIKRINRETNTAPPQIKVLFVAFDWLLKTIDSWRICTVQFNLNAFVYNIVPGRATLKSTRKT